MNRLTPLSICFLLGVLLGCQGPMTQQHSTAPGLYQAPEGNGNIDPYGVGR